VRTIAPIPASGASAGVVVIGVEPVPPVVVVVGGAVLAQRYFVTSTRVVTFPFASRPSRWTTEQAAGAKCCVVPRLPCVPFSMTSVSKFPARFRTVPVSTTRSVSLRLYGTERLPVVRFPVHATFQVLPTARGHWNSSHGSSHTRSVVVRCVVRPPSVTVMFVRRSSWPPCGSDHVVVFVQIHDVIGRA
jgi:hypothetical protein